MAQCSEREHDDKPEPELAGGASERSSAEFGGGISFRFLLRQLFSEGIASRDSSSVLASKTNFRLGEGRELVSWVFRGSSLASIRGSHHDVRGCAELVPMHEPDYAACAIGVAAFTDHRVGIGGQDHAGTVSQKEIRVIDSFFVRVIG